MRCYKAGTKIILELDELPRDRLEIVIKLEDPTALPAMEQEPEFVKDDPRAGYGFDPRVSYTGVEQRPDWMSCCGGPRKLTKKELRGEWNEDDGEGGHGTWTERRLYKIKRVK